jgi:hypothetical protein
VCNLGVVEQAATMLREDSDHRSYFVWIGAADAAWHIEVVARPCVKHRQM